MLDLRDEAGDHRVDAGVVRVGQHLREEVLHVVVLRDPLLDVARDVWQHLHDRGVDDRLLCLRVRNEQRAYLLQQLDELGLLLPFDFLELVEDFLDGPVVAHDQVDDVHACS